MSEDHPGVRPQLPQPHAPPREGRAFEYPQISDELYEKLCCAALDNEILETWISVWQAGCCSYEEAITRAVIVLCHHHKDPYKEPPL
jgi:hypothetical protein